MRPSCQWMTPKKTKRRRIRMSGRGFRSSSKRSRLRASRARPPRWTTGARRYKKGSALRSRLGSKVRRESAALDTALAGQLDDSGGTPRICGFHRKLRLAKIPIAHIGVEAAVVARLCRDAPRATIGQLQRAPLLLWILAPV